MKKAFVWGTAVICVLCLASCGYIAPLQGSGKIVTNTYSASGFTGIEASNVMNVTVTTGSDYSVTVSCDDNIMEHLTVSTKNGTLRLGECDIPSVNPTKMTATVSMPVAVDVINASGASKVSVGNVQAGAFSSIVSGASRVTVETLRADSFDLDISGASSFSVASSSLGGQSLSAAISGDSHAYLFNLPVNTAVLNVSGASDAEANVSLSISGTSSGASSIRYRGSAASSVVCSGASSCDKEN
jgi:hypothetical protein